MNKQVSILSSKIMSCPECGGSRLLNRNEKHGIVCIDCSLVITDDMPTEPNRDNKPREQSNIENTHNRGTILDHMATEKWQDLFKASDHTEENLAFALSEITRMANDLSLPKEVLETAVSLYKTIVKKRLVKGRSINAFCSAVVYAACRKSSFAITLNEIDKVSKTYKKEICHCFKILLKELNYSFPLMSPIQYAPRILNQFNIDGKIAEVVYKILKTAEDLKLTFGKEPAGIISAAIYMAWKLVGEKRTQREIAEITRVTETTIRNRCRELEKHLLIIVNL